jgi:hypothetical protein
MFSPFGDPSDSEVSLVVKIAEHFSAVDSLRIHPGLYRVARQLISDLIRSNGSIVPGFCNGRKYPFEFVGSVDCAQIDIEGVAVQLFSSQSFLQVFATGQIIYIGVALDFDSGNGKLFYAVTLGSHHFAPADFVAELSTQLQGGFVFSDLQKKFELSLPRGRTTTFDEFAKFLRDNLVSSPFFVVSLGFEGFPVIEELTGTFQKLGDQSTRTEGYETLWAQTCVLDSGDVLLLVVGASSRSAADDDDDFSDLRPDLQGGQAINHDEALRNK